MSKQIRTLGYKNALFVGQTDESQRPQGIGIVIDDMFLTCLSKWSSDPIDVSTNIKPSGPVLLLYPHRQIFYSDNFPSSKKFEGFWCYETPEYKIIGKGENKNLAILHVNSKIVSHVCLKDTILQHQQDIAYKDQREKWDKVSQITSQNIQMAKQSVQMFIQHCFSRSMNREQVEENFMCVRNKRLEFLYGIFSKNQGTAFCLKRQAEKLETISVGFYKDFDPTRQISFGRKYIDQINSTSYSIQQGNFDTGAVHCFQYTEKRPSESYKNSRKYFRQMTNFCNQFLQFSEADQIYKKLGGIKKQYSNIISFKYGQRIIQGQKQENNEERQEKPEPPSRKQHYKQTVIINRQYNLQEAKARIQQQVNKRKLLGSANRTGTFYVNSEKKFIGDTKTNNTTDRYRPEDSSPIVKYKLNSQQQTKRYERSPKNSPKKFNYTDRQDNEPEVSEWKRQSVGYSNNQNYYRSPTHHNVPAPRQEKVNNFNLYTVNRENQEPQKRYTYDLQAKKPRRISYQMQPAYDEIDRKIQREMEEKLERFRQEEREMDRKKIQEYKRTILGNLTSYRTSEDPFPKIDANPQHRHHHVPSFNSRQPETGRKQFINYKYTEEQKQDSFYKSPTQFRSKVEPPPISPMKRLATETTTHVNTNRRQVSKSPNLAIRNTTRKIYSYVD